MTPGQREICVGMIVYALEECVGAADSFEQRDDGRKIVGEAFDAWCKQSEELKRP